MDSIRAEVLDFYKNLVKLSFSIFMDFFPSPSLGLCVLEGREWVKLTGSSLVVICSILLCLYMLFSINHFHGLLLVYCLQGTKIIDESHDQDTTDLHKCVAHIRDLTSKVDKSTVS